MKSIIVGFGRIANSIRHDPKIKRYFKYASHAEVLKAHPDFDWIGVVDPSPEARAAAADWGVRAWASIEDVDAGVDFAVLTLPPAARPEVVSALPSLRAVLIEKPLGRSGGGFLDLCAERNIDVSVNYWRRGDNLYRELADWRLRALVGKVQAVFATYGNGLFNNGSHLVDFCRMLFGDARSVTKVTESIGLAILGCSGPAHDVQATFALNYDGFSVLCHPIDYNHYREFGLDIWGTEGRLFLANESLSVLYYPRQEHRGMTAQWEISPTPGHIGQTVGDAFYNLYTSIAEGNSFSPADMYVQEILEEVGC